MDMDDISLKMRRVRDTFIKDIELDYLYGCDKNVARGQTSAVISKRL